MNEMNNNTSQDMRSVKRVFGCRNDQFKILPGKDLDRIRIKGKLHARYMQILVKHSYTLHNQVE